MAARRSPACRPGREVTRGRTPLLPNEAGTTAGHLCLGRGQPSHSLGAKTEDGR